MQRYEPKPWDVRYCYMVRDEQGEYVRYDDTQATITRLTAERDQARAEAAAAYERAAIIAFYPAQKLRAKMACAAEIEANWGHIATPELRDAILARIDQRKENKT